MRWLAPVMWRILFVGLLAALVMLNTRVPDLSIVVR